MFDEGQGETCLRKDRFYENGHGKGDESYGKEETHGSFEG